MSNLKTPDVTLAQVLAGITFVVGQAVSMGVIDGTSSKLVLSAAVTAVTAVWTIADSIIRHGRATGNTSR